MKYSRYISILTAMMLALAGCTENSTEDPSKNPPTEDPTQDPTEDPTQDPTEDPTQDPTKDPTKDPTQDPTEDPTKDPDEQRDENGCLPDEVYVSGKCYDQNACDPQCKDGQTCKDGTCYLCVAGNCYLVNNNDKEPENKTCENSDDCADGEVCVDGVCGVLANDTCTPECATGEICVNNECRSQKLLWSLCRNDSDCGNGKCLFMVKPSREMTYNGVMYGTSDNINIPVSVIDSRINAAYYNRTHETQADEADEIGICSTDCTKSKDACGDGWVCQVVIKGESPYPDLNAKEDVPENPGETPVDPGETPENPGEMPENPGETPENPGETPTAQPTVTLPFEIAESELTQTGFSAICRPVMTADLAKDTPYGAELCNANEEKCKAAGQVFVNGMCLEACNTAEIECPYGFSCTDVENNAKVCMPNSGTCGECYDADGDGSGYGHCAKAGVDCNDDREDIYFGKQLTCDDLTNADGEKVYEDHNCNGIIDAFELIGTLDNCSACGQACAKPGPGVAITCEITSQTYDISSDWWKTATAETVVPEFACIQQCAFGYGDCDNNAMCQTELLNANARLIASNNEIYKDQIRTSWILSAPKSGSLLTADRDGDNYPGINTKVSKEVGEIVIDKDNSVICCGSGTKDKGHTCYTADANWTTISRPNDLMAVSDSKIKDVGTYDSDDTDSAINPEAVEVCDGIDNDGSTIITRQSISCDDFCSSSNNKDICNTIKTSNGYVFNPYCDATVDGSNDPKPYVDPKTGNKSFLNEACSIRNDGGKGDICNDNGVTVCKGKERKLDCGNNDIEFNNVPDGLIGGTFVIDNYDNDCDGYIDEDAVVPCLIVAGGNAFKDAVNNKNCVNSNNCMFEAYPSESGYLDKLNSKSFLNADGSINLCRLGVIEMSYSDDLKIDQGSGALATYYPTCKPLYEPREYDFFGDGIDSNCDGFDYDLKHTVFVSSASQGEMQGNDAHDCKYSSEGNKILPCESINRAIEKAKITNNAYADIILSSDNMSIKSPIVIPTSSTTNSLLNASVLHETKTDDKGVVLNEGHITSRYRLHERLIEQYIKETNSKNSYLYSYEKCEIVDDKYECTLADRVEENQPTELIRIYGGFTPATKASDPWLPAESGKAQIKTSLTYKIDKVDKVVYHMLETSGNKRVSLKMNNLGFNMFAGSASNVRVGTTFIGFNFPYGVNRLILNNVSVDVTAPNGVDAYINTTAANGNDGIDGRNGSHMNADDTDNLLGQSVCTPTNGTGGGGGCGGNIYNQVNSEHDKKYHSYGDKGRDGTGIDPGLGGAGAGGSNNSCKRDSCSGCGDSKYVDPNKPVGAGGKGGAGGDNGVYINSLKFKLYTPGNSLKTDKNSADDERNTTGAFLYVDSSPYNGDGKDGAGGGGGGGGLVYFAYEMDGRTDHRTYAGAGGSGGAGGKGGKGGYTGGSAIGMYIANDGSNSVISFDAVKTTTTNGSGSKGQTGGAGGNGGGGGNQYAFADTYMGRCSYCEKATKGGGGGGGGAGGNGAFGQAGFSYPYVLRCTKNVEFTYTKMTTLKNCGYSITQELLDNASVYGTQNLSGAYKKLEAKAHSGSDANAQTGGKAGTNELKYEDASIVDKTCSPDISIIVRTLDYDMK